MSSCGTCPIYNDILFHTALAVEETHEDEGSPRVLVYGNIISELLMHCSFEFVVHDHVAIFYFERSKGSYI